MQSDGTSSPVSGSLDYQTPPPAPAVSRAAYWAGWIIGVIPCLLLFLSASFKLTQAPMAVEGFKKAGYPAKALFILGVVEAGSALLYLFPRTAVLGAIVLTGYLGGATDSHVRNGEVQLVIPVLCGVMLWLGLLLRESRLRPLLPIRK